MNEEMQPLGEHLGELRHRLIWVVSVFIISLVVSLMFATDIFHWIRQDSLKGIAIHALSPGDSLKVYMQIAFILSFIITSPVLLYHIWQFVRPGLSKDEQRVTLLYIPLAIGLFMLGLSFGYFLIFPYIIQFTIKLNTQFGLLETYGVYQYFSFLFSIIFPLALFFQLPVIVLFLTRLRILKAELLTKFRRFAYFALVIVAAIITPPDLISNILVGIPLILLYEISIWLAIFMERKMEREEVSLTE